MPLPLIVNADDYALTEGVSRGIMRAHREGIVTTTSVLAVGEAFERTVPWLRDAPGLGVGVHLCLVGGEVPLCPPSSIRSLVDRSGRLHASARDFLLGAAARRIDPAEVEHELAAQIERVRDAGLPVGHLDSHQHLHLWPAVREITLRLARRFAIPAVRVPRSRGRRLGGVGIALLGSRLAERARQEGIAFPVHAAGFDEAGRMDRALLLDVLGRLSRTASGPVEIGVHPGAPDDPARARYRWGYRWEQELEALIDERTRRAVTALGFTPATYATAMRGAVTS